MDKQNCQKNSTLARALVIGDDGDKKKKKRTIGVTKIREVRQRGKGAKKAGVYSSAEKSGGCGVRVLRKYKTNGGVNS